MLPPFLDLVQLKGVKNFVNLLSHLSNFGSSHDTYCKLGTHSKYILKNKSGLKQLEKC